MQKILLQLLINLLDFYFKDNIVKILNIFMGIITYLDENIY